MTQRAKRKLIDAHACDVQIVYKDIQVPLNVSPEKVVYKEVPRPVIVEKRVAQSVERTVYKVHILAHASMHPPTHTQTHTRNTQPQAVRD